MAKQSGLAERTDATLSVSDEPSEHLSTEPVPPEEPVTPPKETPPAPPPGVPEPPSEVPPETPPDVPQPPGEVPPAPPPEVPLESSDGLIAGNV